jgi:uncharacterized protein YbjQ (UPF0145 family)
MASWEGGLPPAAHERIARQRASGVAGSLLTAPGAASIRSVDLEPIGEVFGCVVMQLGWSGGGCGIWNSGFGGGAFGGGGFAVGGGYTGWNTPVLTTGGRGGHNAGFGSYVHAWAIAWHGAHDRMVAEAAALGADGVVGVVIRRERLEGNSWEYTAMGTAVRTLNTALTPSARTSGVWTAGFAPEEVTALVQSGYVPRGMALGLSVSTKHEDQHLKAQRSMWSDNTEIDGLTQLLEGARDDARVQLTKRATPLHGSDIVVTDSFVGEFETPCGEEVDLHAEAMFVGTVIAPGPMNAFRNHSDSARSARDIVTVMPVNDPGRRNARRSR